MEVQKQPNGEIFLWMEPKEFEDLNGAIGNVDRICHERVMRLGYDNLWLDFFSTRKLIAVLKETSIAATPLTEPDPQG